MFSFGLTFKAYDWLVEGGIKEVFLVLASVQVVVCLLSIPMCKSRPIHFALAPFANHPRLDIYGKRNRSFFYRHDLLKMTGLK
jgi:hypothetical protein